MSVIDEDAAMSIFTDEEGNAALSNGYKKQIAVVLKSGLGRHTTDVRRILAYLPCIRPRRKTIPYLQPKENLELHGLFDGDGRSDLSLRDKAIGTILFFTG